MDGLPTEVWLEVLSFLNPRDLLQAVQLTCWSFNFLGKDERLWQKFCAAECAAGELPPVLRRLVSETGGEDVPKDSGVLSFLALYRRLFHAPFLLWDPDQPLTVSGEGLTARQPSEGWTTTSTRQPLKAGRVSYFELTFSAFGGSSFLIGVGLKSCLGASEWCLERGRGSFYHCSGTVYSRTDRGESSLDTSTTYHVDDTIGVYVDLRQGKITWFLNGTQVTGLVDLPELKDQELYPMVSWGGTSYCITLGVAPTLPLVDHALKLPIAV